ncbi:MAG: hypothetical protein R6V32_09685 [Bacteroidales bacterium]
MKNTSNYMPKCIALFAIILFGQLNLFGQDEPILWELGGNYSNDFEVFGRYGGAGDLYFFNSADNTSLADYDMVLTYDPSYLGIGTLNPTSDLHIHSSILSPVDESGDGGDSDISTRDIIQLQKSVARLQLTNHETGITEDDGLLIKMYNNTASIYNQESGDLRLISNNITINGGNLAMNENQIYFKASDDDNHRINYTNENDLDGLHIQGNRGVEIATKFDGTVMTVRDGNVGVGTNSPENRLHVERGVSATGVHDYDKYAAFINNGGGSGAGLRIKAGSNSDDGYPLLVQNNYDEDILVVSSRGKVGIGTAEPVYKLDVCGTAHFNKVIVESGWCDYVFEEEYDLMPLETLDAFVKANKHLPGIPTEAEVLENGVDLGEMNKKLLEKVEELSLYIIEQEKRIQKLEKQLNQ